MSQKSAVVYSQPNCPGCNSAKVALRVAGYAVEERVLGSGWTKEQLWKDFPGARSVPQIIVDSVPIGDLQKLNEFLAD